MPVNYAKIFSQSRPANLSDSALFDLVQKANVPVLLGISLTRSVDWSREEAMPTSGYGHETVTIGGTGFGVMSVITSERKWISRDTAARFLLKWSISAESRQLSRRLPSLDEWLYRQTIPFSRKTTGPISWKHLTCYRATSAHASISTTITIPKGNSAIVSSGYGKAWNGIGSPKAAKRSSTGTGARTMGGLWTFPSGDSMNAWSFMYWRPVRIQTPFRTKCITAVGPKAISSSKRKSILQPHPPAWFRLWGPLFFSHYSFLGLDPRGLKDQYADYWEQNSSHTLINHDHCVNNPRQFKGYGANCWGWRHDTYDG